MKNKIVFAFTVIFTALFILSFSVSLPICIREFYYSQIEALNIPEASGETKENVIIAFDELMNSLVGNDEFKTGVFSCSEDAKAHFLDCKWLFGLDFAVLLISSVFLVLYFIFKYIFKKIPKTKSFSPTFYGALIALIPIVFFGVYLLIDLNGAYLFFHQIFFAGKDNWSFHPVYDSIINILPMQFFINCGVLIGVFVILLSVVFIVLKIYSCFRNRISK